MKTSAFYSEAPQLGTYRFFELKNDTLVVEHITKNRGKTGSLIVELARIVLPSIQTEGRNVKMLKGSINILVFVAVVAMSVRAIFTVPPEWVWAGAGIIALPFFVTLLQSLRKNRFEVFKDAQGETLFEIRRAKGDEEEFAAFLAGLKAAMQQDRTISEQPIAAERGDVANAANAADAHTEGAALPPPLPRANATDAQAEALEKKVTSGARWLYWVAGLSGVNILLTHLEATWRFAIGLGVTELVYAVGMQLGSIGTAVGMFLTIIALGFLVFLGFFAAKQHSWAFILGIIALTLDTLLLIALTGTELLVGIVFHVVAIVFLCLGYGALRKLKKHRSANDA